MNGQQGSALIVVLILCTALMLISQVMLNTAFLQLKMVQHYAAQKRIYHKALEELIQLEKQLENHPHVLSPAIKFIQFVPDTVAENESDGTDYYRIEVKCQQEDGSQIQLISTYAIRHEIPYDAFTGQKVFPQNSLHRLGRRTLTKSHINS